MAAENHIPVLLAIPGISLKWVGDRDETRARTIGRAYDLEGIGITSATSLPPADVVFLAIPYGARRSYYDELSQRGSAVYVEKPLVRTLAEFDELTARFPAERLGCGFQRRSSAACQTLRGFVAGQLFGRLLAVRVEYGVPGTRSGGYQSDIQMAGGGPLLDVAIHAVDLAIFAAAAVDARVEHVNMTRDGDFDLDTNARLSLRSRDYDIQMSLHTSSLQFTRFQNEYSFEHATVTHDIWGSGALSVRPHVGESFSVTGHAVAYPVTPAQVLHRHLSCFFQGIGDEMPNYTAAIDSRVTTKVIAQLYGWE